MAPTITMGTIYAQVQTLDLKKRPTRLSESFTKFTNMSKKKKSFIATPDLVPWLPPGKTKEETFNSFAHKKNSGVYDLSASMQANDKIWSTNNSKKFSTDSSPWSIRWKKE